MNEMIDVDMITYENEDFVVVKDIMLENKHYVYTISDINENKIRFFIENEGNYDPIVDPELFGKLILLVTQEII